MVLYSCTFFVQNLEGHVELQTQCRDRRTKDIIPESSLVDVIQERFQL